MQCAPTSDFRDNPSPAPDGECPVCVFSNQDANATFELATIGAKKSKAVQTDSTLATRLRTGERQGTGVGDAVSERVFQEAQRHQVLYSLLVLLQETTCRFRDQSLRAMRKPCRFERAERRAPPKLRRRRIPAQSIATVKHKGS